MARSRLAPEDRLTRMLAYLSAEEPDLLTTWLNSVGIDGPEAGVWEVGTQVVDQQTGRFDLVLSKPGDARIIVESKLGSGFGDQQLERYVAFLAKQPDRLRALIPLTESNVVWANELAAAAADIR